VLLLLLHRRRRRVKKTSNDQVQKQGRQPADDIVRVNTRVVFIDALVKDKKKNVPVRNLTRDNFTVLDDGRVRDLTYFSTEGETRRPRALMMVIDFKGHWGRTFHNKETVSRLASALAKLPPEDELAIAISWLGKAASPCSPLNPDALIIRRRSRYCRNLLKIAEKLSLHLNPCRSFQAKYERDYKKIDWNYSLENTASGIACASELLHREAAKRPNSQAIMVVAADDLTYFPFEVRDQMIHSSFETGITTNLLRIRTFFLTGWAAEIAKKTDFEECREQLKWSATLRSRRGRNGDRRQC
jgi:hypothetical protein